MTPPKVHYLRGSPSGMVRLPVGDVLSLFVALGRSSSSTWITSLQREKGVERTKYWSIKDMLES